jgi:hypothetical protein
VGRGAWRRKRRALAANTRRVMAERLAQRMRHADTLIEALPV